MTKKRVPAKPKPQGGRPEFEPTNVQRAEVKALAAYGAPQAYIAARLGIARNTLAKHFRPELDWGLVEANLEVSKSLFKKAKDGDLGAMVWWEKTRAKQMEAVEHRITAAVDAGTTISREMTEQEAADAWAQSINGDA